MAPILVNIKGIDALEIDGASAASVSDGIASFAVGGGSSIDLQTNGVDNGDQTKLNLQEGTGITLTDNGSGTVTIDASGGGGGTVTTTGTPASGNLSKFSGTTSITNADLTGDVTTSGGVATTIAALAVTTGKIAASAVTEAKIGLSNVTTNDVSITKHGFAPIAPNDATKFLDGTGAYSTPASAPLAPSATNPWSCGWRNTGTGGFTGPWGPMTMGGSSGTLVNVVASGTEPSYLQFQTSTLTTVAADTSQNDPVAGKFTRGSFRRFHTRVQLPGNAGIRVWVGLTDIVSTSVNATFKSDTPTANFIGFRFSTGVSDTKWQGVCQTSGAAQTVSSSAAAIDTVGHDLDVIMVGAVANLYIDAVLIATISTNVPAAATTLGWTFFIENLVGATAKLLNLSCIFLQLA